jgi:hypothetical protein
LTHETVERAVRRALDAIARSGVVATPPRLLRIQE